MITLILKLKFNGTLITNNFVLVFFISKIIYHIIFFCMIKNDIFQSEKYF